MTKDVGDLESFIAVWLKEQLDQEVDSGTNFGAIGMDSLDAVRFTDDLAMFIGVEEVPVSLILDHPTPGELARHLVNALAEENSDLVRMVSA